MPFLDLVEDVAADFETLEDAGDFPSRKIDSVRKFGNEKAPIVGELSADEFFRPGVIFPHV